MNIHEARTDPELFGRMYADRASWAAWDAVLKGAFAIPMDRAERRRFKRLTDRTPPKRQVKELWIVAGRRSGKTLTASEVATYLAAVPDYKPYLARGERALVMLLAVDRSQAKVALG